jgi:hypothetical protein
LPGGYGEPAAYPHPPPYAYGTGSTSATWSSTTPAPYPSSSSSSSSSSSASLSSYSSSSSTWSHEAPSSYPTWSASSSSSLTVPAGLLPLRAPPARSGASLLCTQLHLTATRTASLQFTQQRRTVSHLSIRLHRTARVTARLLTQAVVCILQAESLLTQVVVCTRPVASLLTLLATLRHPRTTRPPKPLQLTPHLRHARSLTPLELRPRPALRLAS